VILAPTAFPNLAHAGGFEVRQVTDEVCAIVGELGRRSPENPGNTSVDQDAFRHLLNLDQLARRNAQEAVTQLEFDF